jgi:hypothetical protein
MTRRSFPFLLMVVAGLAGVPAVALADVLILSPGSTAYRVGQTLGDGATLTVPAGTTVQVVLPNGDTLAVAGPASKPVSALTRGVGRDAAAWRRWVEQLAGGGSSERPTGGVRGARP